jgi:PTH1 family peptidyl-tRNA hydrolase
MFALFGLGNPGGEYATTRHNLGFMVLEAVARKLQTQFAFDEGNFLIAEQSIRDEEILLVKPLTYMNNSGRAVEEIVSRYRLEIEKLLVIVDDFHLPMGTIRIRRSGTDGGHNGLRSICDHLQTTGIARMRCGIAGQRMPVKKSQMAEFVLSSFDSDELPAVQKLLERAADAAIMIALTGIDRAMQEFNKNI